MKVYFTASSSGSSHLDRKVYLRILKSIVGFKHKLTNPYYQSLVQKSGSEFDNDKFPQDVFRTLRAQIVESACVIAEVTVPSTSLGIQIEYALNNKIPVLCLYKSDGSGDLPLMVRDYKNSLLFKHGYDEANLDGIIKDFLVSIPKITNKFNMYISHEQNMYLSYLSKRSKLPKSEVVRQLLQDKLGKDKSYVR